MKTFTALSALAIAAVSAPAMAQDESTPFSGPYVAGMAGYDKLRIDSPIGASSDDGVLFGGVVGYDLNVRGVVIGIEGEYSDSNTKETSSIDVGEGDIVTSSLKTGRDLYVGARLGGEIVPGVLLYAKGGYTNAKLKAVISDGDESESDSIKLDGYRLGAGVETEVAGFLARLEYRYSRYQDLGDAFQPERHQVAAMVGYRF